MTPERWQQVKNILATALARTPSERSAFLDQACNEPELRREVESLIAAHGAGDTTLFGAPATEIKSALDPGTKLGPYEITARIGAGGMGVVYRARDTRLQRDVAIKVLTIGLLTDEAAQDRFRKEALALAKLNHPNIATVYDVGEQGGTDYIVMECISGQSLAEKLKLGSLPEKEAVSLGAQIAAALDEAHSHGIVHRDLKPGNIMITPKGQSKVLDFGLAKLVRPLANSTTQTFATTKGIAGTLAYMSPEQVRGEELDSRTDLFSFGAVLYEMVTGVPPFRGETYGVIAEAILNREPVAPVRLNPGVSSKFEEVINKALEKDRKLRCQSAAEIWTDLQRLERDSNSGRAFAVAAGVGLSNAPEVVSKQAEPPQVNLPAQRTVFVGREKEIAAVKELLLRPDVRLLTITGPGGIGKTRLAVEVAGGVGEHFQGGVYFIPLAALRDPALIAPAIIQALGIREAGSQLPLELLKKNLQDPSRAPTLFLLDSFEHLTQAAPIVAELLAVGPNLRILVTSRAALHLYGEHEFPVPPLPVPNLRAIPPVETLSQYAAVALFVQAAVAARPDFELDQHSAPAVIEICARLDGLPLAIELAAARVKVLSLASIRTRLASRFQLLTGGARDLPQRQQTLRSAIDWSHELLSAAEQRLFRRLSVFVGGCTLEGVEAVCDAKGDLDLDVLDGMASMVDKSLVQNVEQANGESRFQMLETIREYAREKLEASTEETFTRRAHAAYCLVLAEEESIERDGTKWLEDLALEHDNFRAALEWLTATGDADWGLRLGTALFRFWEMREHIAEGRDRLAKLLKLPGAAARTKMRERALFATGVFAEEQGDYASADSLMKESLDIARELRDIQGAAVALNALGVLARDRGDITVAHSRLEESLVLWKELGDDKAVARSLSNLGNVAKLQGDYPRARSLHAECLSIFRAVGDLPGVAWSLNHQGDVARDQGDSAAARILYEQGLAIFRDLGDRWGVAGTLADLGSLAREQGDHPTARSLYRESLSIFRELQDKRGIARLLECFASLAAAQQQAGRSLRLAGAAALLRQNIGVPRPPAEQAKLDAILDTARQALSGAEGAAAWSEGLTMSLEKAIDEVMNAEISASSS